MEIYACSDFDKLKVSLSRVGICVFLFIIPIEQFNDARRPRRQPRSCTIGTIWFANTNSWIAESNLRDCHCHELQSEITNARITNHRVNLWFANYILWFTMEFYDLQREFYDSRKEFCDSQMNFMICKLNLWFARIYEKCQNSEQCRIILIWTRSLLLKYFVDKFWEISE